MKRSPQRTRQLAHIAAIFIMTIMVSLYFSSFNSSAADGAIEAATPFLVITNSGTADDMIYNLPGGDGNNQAILEDDGVADNGMSQLRSANGSFDTVIFANPANTLTINASNDGEKITVNEVDSGFAAQIHLIGGTGADTFALGNGATLKGGGISGADDTLDYSAYTTPVWVNLGLHINLFDFILTGAQETPNNSSNAFALAGLNYDVLAPHTIKNFQVEANGITPDQVTGIKLRRGSVNTPGPVVLDLLSPTVTHTLVAFGINGFEYKSESFPLPPEHEAAFLGGLLYVEVETTSFPGGEIRGQIISSTPAVIGNAGATGIADLGVLSFKTIIGGSGNDSLVGNFETNILIGGPGDDTLFAGPGNGSEGNKVQGEGGNDSLLFNFDSVEIGIADEIVDGGEGNDLVNVNGRNGTDQFFAEPAMSSPSVAGRLFLYPDSGGKLSIGTVETLTTNGVNGNDRFIFPGLSGVNDLTSININGMFGDDAFTITPSTTITYNINGGEGGLGITPLNISQGNDVLTVDTIGTTNLALSAINTATGTQGSYTFGDRKPVNFQTLSAVNPSAVKVSDVTVAEGNSGSSVATFIVSLEAPTNITVTVDYVTLNGTASSPGDYQAVNGTVSFSPGQTTRFVSVPVNGDTLPEGNETVILNLANPVNALISDSQGIATITDDDASNIFQFSTASVTASEAAGVATVTVTRTGSTAAAANVRYETSDLLATQSGDYTFGSGVIQFAPGEVSKSFNLLLINDAVIEGAETFGVTLSNASGNSAVGSPGQVVITITDDDITPGANPIDDATFFVRQHYLDFLGREADADGLAFWVSNITSCGSDLVCREARRVNVSAAFFLSIEFQETSGFAIRTNRVAFGRLSADASSRLPYLQFMRDTRQIGAGVIVGETGHQAKLESNKQAYAQQIVTSPAFLSRFPITAAAPYVDALYASAGVTPTDAERTTAINAFGAGGTSGRVAALRAVGDSASVRQAELNASFVLAEYYGYLRRNPTDAPDFSDDGYQFWLSKLNSFGGDFARADMVKAFINSIEYRNRFGQ